MNRAPRNEASRHVAATLIALVCTLLLLAGLERLVTQSPSPPKPQPKRVAVQVTQLPRFDRVRSQPKKVVKNARKRVERKKKRPKEETKLNGQVVETARPKDERAPDKSKYLGKFNMKVEREQKSRGRKRKTKQLGTKTVANPSKLQSPDSTSLAPTRIARRKKPTKKRRARKRRARAQKQVAKLSPAPMVKVGPGRPSAEGAQAKRPSVLRTERHELLLPATSASNIVHNIQALAGSPGSDDYLPDVNNEGDTNLLNTRKFRYWDFFQRVRTAVRAEWNPSGALRSRDPSGKRFGVRDRYTVLRVRLNPAGNLKSIQVHKQSGLGFLDAEARRAFMAAGPYPNPPRGLVNHKGEVEFRFGFMFEISASRFRFHRLGR